jgi:hypothetical protein
MKQRHAFQARAATYADDEDVASLQINFCTTVAARMVEEASAERELAKLQREGKTRSELEAVYKAGWKAWDAAHGNDDTLEKALPPAFDARDAATALEMLEANAKRLDTFADTYRAHGHDAQRRFRYFGMMRMKYARAARYPWLPVAPDPPKPRWLIEPED